MASQLPRPGMKTASRCTVQTARGTYAFEISGYSMLIKLLSTGKFIRSATFEVGGYEFCISLSISEESKKDHVAVYLELLTNKAEATVLFDFRFIDQATTKSDLSVFCSPTPMLFSTMDAGAHSDTWGTTKFMERSELEESPYLRDDCLVIECDVTVVKGPEVVETYETHLIQMPSPNLYQDLASLLETKEGADVTFVIDGEVIAAHALVLAMRSSVFKAEFYGPLREKREQPITIEDIQPDAFRALIDFIYTDSMLPSMADLDRDETKELIQQVLVAADRYDVQGLKAVCEKALCESIDVETVAATLALADQQNCSNLKNACIDFIICPDRWDGVAASEGFMSSQAFRPRCLGRCLTQSRQVSQNLMYLSRVAYE